MNIKLKLRNCKYFVKKSDKKWPKQYLVKRLFSWEKKVDIHNR